MYVSITHFHEIHAILGGEISKDADYPKYIVSVRNVKRDTALFGNGHVCSGVIISNRTVLTAAKCVFIDK